MKPQRCEYKRGAYKCGSFAFNLRHESIDQGKTCDKCYWETRALAAEAVLDERYRSKAELREHNTKATL
jgi:hypothetical protein